MTNHTDTNSTRTLDSGVHLRSDHAAVWTGDEMIAWGGSRPVRGERARVRSEGGGSRPVRGERAQTLSDGAAYTPSSDTWRRLAPSPLRSAPSRILGTGLEVHLDAAWTGTRMLVWNGIAGAGYEPRTNAWKPLAPPPPQPWLPEDAAVRSGAKMLIWGGCCRGSCHHRDGALYSPR